jgi:hypothetical protein
MLILRLTRFGVNSLNFFPSDLSTKESSQGVVERIVVRRVFERRC